MDVCFIWTRGFVGRDLRFYFTIAITIRTPWRSRRGPSEGCCKTGTVAISTSQRVLKLQAICGIPQWQIWAQIIWRNGFPAVRHEGARFFSNRRSIQVRWLTSKKRKKTSLPFKSTLSLQFAWLPLVLVIISPAGNTYSWVYMSDSKLKTSHHQGGNCSYSKLSFVRLGRLGYDYLA